LKFQEQSAKLTCIIAPQADEFQQMEYDNNMQLDEEGHLPDEYVEKV